MELNYNKVPKLRGKDAKVRFKKATKALALTRWPLYFVGPSGSGKTIIAMNVAKYYATKNNVPAYYVQLSPDQTKTSLILGLRLDNGSLVPKRGVVANAMDEGAIIVVDEAPHASQELLLMFNSICDRTSVTAIGDDSVVAEDTFRVIFCGNTSNYAANQKLPQSFAQRMIAFNFDFPNAKDEASIAYKMYCDELNGNRKVPSVVAKYVTGIIREARNERFPLSVRNVAAALMLMDISLEEDFDYENANQLEIEKAISAIGGENTESLMNRVFSMIHGMNSNIERVLDDQQTHELFAFVTHLTADTFVDSVLSATMYWLDVEGMEFDMDEIKSKLRASIF